ncbi:MAG TPA: hypothetical protein VFH06_00805 [Candidatus Saccharimonadales bacterium]|nr:hypothetical protein [Candidatus Saccharimonadales bacterium]
MAKDKTAVSVFVAARTYFNERSRDYAGGPGYSGAPSLQQLPGSAANRRRLKGNRRALVAV